MQRLAKKLRRSAVGPKHHTSAPGIRVYGVEALKPQTFTNAKSLSQMFPDRRQAIEA